MSNIFLPRLPVFHRFPASTAVFPRCTSNSVANFSVMLGIFPAMALAAGKIARSAKPEKKPSCNALRKRFNPSGSFGSVAQNSPIAPPKALSIFTRSLPRFSWCGEKAVPPAIVEAIILEVILLLDRACPAFLVRPVACNPLESSPIPLVHGSQPIIN